MHVILHFFFLLKAFSPIEMSCLFVSIGTLVGRSHARVRADVCDYMQQHMTTDHMGLPFGAWMGWQQEQEQEQEQDNATAVGEGESNSVPWNVERAEAYVAHMRGSNTWGGAMEIAAATRIYACDIIVVSEVGGGGRRVVAEFLAPPSLSSRPRLTISWNGSHYQAAAGYS